MTVEIRPPAAEEPAVRSPELQRLVLLAQDPPLPRLRGDVAAVHAAVDATRRRRRGLALVGGLGLAAGLAALALTRVAPPPTSPSGHVAQDMSPEPAPPARPPAPALAAAVRITAEGDAPGPTVLGAWEVGLAPGRYAVEVDDHPGDEVLRARSPGGSVELHHGRVHILVAASHSEARLEHGVATWVAPDGARSPLAAPSGAAPAPPDAPADAPVDPSALARRAEELLRAGKRDAAIKLLAQVSTAHPQHPTARQALLDLGRLLKAEGRTDEARCAYRLYLGRYSGKAQLADEVEKALARLGDGPACRGLRPR
jgi:tetratricopeptide (TPR) repeat protein